MIVIQTFKIKITMKSIDGAKYKAQLIKLFFDMVAA